MMMNWVQKCPTTSGHGPADGVTSSIGPAGPHIGAVSWWRHLRDNPPCRASKTARFGRNPPA